MVEKAIEKIKAEIGKNNNPYVKVVGEYLLKIVEDTPGAAEKILQQDKTILKSLDEMKKEAEKKKVGNCAVLTDQEGFETVLKYFGIEAKPAAVKYTSPEPVIETPEVKSKPSSNFNVNLEDLL